MRNQPISDILRKIRLLHEYKLEYIADYLGICTEAYRRKETGQNDPKFSTIEKLALLYGISVAQLIEFDLEAIAKHLPDKSSR